MTADKLVSVIIPMFNAEAHISATLSAIIHQDYSNLEIIIVNDASSDSSRLIASDLLEGSGRKYLIIDQPSNLGVSAARNTGLAASHGQYVWFCDSDDLPARNFVSIMCAEAEAKNADAVFCGIRHYHESEGKFTPEPVKLRDNLSSPEDYFTAWANSKLAFWNVWSFLFRKELITSNYLRFNESCTFGEDTEFLLKALANASRVSFVREMLYTYVHHSRQVSTAGKAPEILDQLMLARFRTRRFLAKRIRSRKVNHYLLSYYLPNAIIKRYTEYAHVQDKCSYDRLIMTLKHKRLRRLMLSTVRFLLVEPELFFKSAALLYAPNLYYRLRKGD